MFFESRGIDIKSEVVCLDMMKGRSDFYWGFCNRLEKVLLVLEFVSGFCCILSIV